MIFRPAFRLLTGPLPPLRLAARFLAAVILPPLLFFMSVSFVAKSTRLRDRVSIQNEDTEADALSAASMPDCARLWKRSALMCACHSASRALAFCWNSRTSGAHSG